MPRKIKYKTEEERLAASRVSKRKWAHANKSKPAVKRYRKEYYAKYYAEIKAGKRNVRHKFGAEELERKAEDRRRKDRERKRREYAKDPNKSKERLRKYRCDIKEGRRKVKHKIGSDKVFKEHRKKRDRDNSRKNFKVKKKKENQQLIHDYNKKYG